MLLEKDAEALKLAQKRLLVPVDTDEEVRKLKLAIEQCSEKTKLLIFSQASAIRRENWSSPESYTRAKIERTIPIFQALCASVEDDWKHACYAQLGYVNKDKEAPDWKEAFALLTIAIDLRAKVTTPLHGRYELNRAICEIMLDDSIANIKGDLQIARKFPREREILQMLCVGSNEKIAHWLGRAGIYNTNDTASDPHLSEAAQ